MNQHRSIPLTLSLPARDVHALTRLAELTGRSFREELLSVLAMYEDAHDAVGDTLSHLFAVKHGGEAWEPLPAPLPAWAIAALRDTAARYGATPSEALAVMTRGLTRSLLQAEGIALLERKPLSEAFCDMIARDAA